MPIYQRSGARLTAPSRRPLPYFDGLGDGFILGQTEPTWANSGVNAAGLPARTNNATTEIVTTSPGQVIENLNLPNARIRVRHPGVIIRNCLIQYGPADGRLLIQNHCAIVHEQNADTTGNIVSYCTFDPVNAKASTDVNDAAVSGMFGYGFTAYRCAVHNVTDGFMPDVTSVKTDPSHILGCRIETRYLTYDPEQVNSTEKGTHNDGVQLAGGVGHRIIGNSIHQLNGANLSQYAMKGQCVVATPYHQPRIADVTVANNWLYGGYTQVSMWPAIDGGGPAIEGVTVTGNRHYGSCVWPYLQTPATKLLARDVSNNTAPNGLTYNGSQTTAPGGAIYVNTYTNIDPAKV